MMSNTFHTSQASVLPRPNRLIAAHISPQQQHLNDQLIHENAAFIQSTLPTNNLAYLQQQSQICSNLNSQNNHHHQPQQSQPQFQAHSLLTSNQLGASTSTLFDPCMGRLFTTSSATGVPQLSNATDLVDNSISRVPHASNTILINNFAHLQTDQAQQLFPQHSISTNSQQFQHHVPAPLQIQHSNLTHQRSQHSLQHQQQQQPQYFSQSAHIATTTTSPPTMQLHFPTAQSFIVSADELGSSASSSKIPTYLPSIVNSTLAPNVDEIQLQHQHQHQHHLPTSSTEMSSSSISTTTSPVVLDRINICINNHYTDPTGRASNVSTSSGAGGIFARDTPPMPSPIIPPIQHSSVIDPSLLIEPLAMNNDASITPLPPVINEPDSTTTSHTPPTTPGASTSTCAIATIQSPSTSSTAAPVAAVGEEDEEISDKHFVDNVKLNSNVTVTVECNTLPESSENITENDEVIIIEDTPITPVVSDSKMYESTQEGKTPDVVFTIGEDVFVKREDDRLYLGTIIDSKYQKCRVRFDDGTEVWCSTKEIRKFGGRIENSNSPLKKSEEEIDVGPLCVACKLRDEDKVEICERCGRGYHHKCTTETFPGSDDWICKRCSKSLKIEKPNKHFSNATSSSHKRQLPYDITSLTWDSKHRVNQEQIYCYCGKTGQFDNKMLQCCKCLNWYHISCMKDFKSPILRGDGFFVFSCSVCSEDGKEFLRRLQMNCVDFLHLVLYNLSAQKKHQYQKYHHLTKDIFPFIQLQRDTSAFPEEWVNVSEKILQSNVSNTLIKNTDRFISGREVKRDHCYYGLRTNGPPILPKINVKENDTLSDKFLVEHLGLKLSKRAVENRVSKNITNETITSFAIQVKDVYEFQADEDDADDADEDDEKFTSDDEIPIKHIIEKEKNNCKKRETENYGSTKSATKRRSSTILDNADDEDVLEAMKSKENPVINTERRSHKRKAFTLSKPYRETATAAAASRYLSVRNCDSSSDENSSSSRATSLDLIIPPPKDFLGLNNPFRVVTPKNNCEKKSIPFGPAIKSSVLNTSALDFSSKLAALKSAGIFPNLNTTNLTKAAGQPRMVRTIKRRLSAKDIMIGPNQEVRRRRTRRLSSNVEVISTTTINPLPTNVFPINAKDLFTSGSSTTIRKQSYQNIFSKKPPSTLPQTLFTSSSTTSTSTFSFVEGQLSTTSMKTQQEQNTILSKPTHGRRLRVRKQKTVPTDSRRSSLSSASTSSTSSCIAARPPTATATSYAESTKDINDLHESVNKYFGISNRLLNGEKFTIHAKRDLPNGQTQYLIEWGSDVDNENNEDSSANSELVKK